MAIKYRKVKTEEQIPTQMICNKCGKSVDLHKDFPGGFTTIDTIYGYGSKKDGSRYQAHICESCMDAFYKTFKIPPSISDGDFWL